jgi:hypothetical protein
MTTLAAWVSVDSQKPSACYLVSDSRITWADGNWDSGQKLFVSSRFPDIFGYSGDVQFPTLALRQVIDRMDQGLLFASNADSALRHQVITSELQNAYCDYPAHPTTSSTILHFSRDGAGKHANFSLWRLDWSRDSAVRSTSLDLPTASVIGETAGSGWRILIDRNDKWKKAQGRTARGVFSSFCDALESQQDPRSAGPPQLVGLYPSFPSRMFGVVWRENRYLAGQLAPGNCELGNFEWRNCLFERVDPWTLQRLEGAQPQPRPRDL